jgi:hypothetical protein
MSRGGGGGEGGPFADGLQMRHMAQTSLVRRHGAVSLIMAWMSRLGGFVWLMRLS